VRQSGRHRAGKSGPRLARKIAASFRAWAHLPFSSRRDAIHGDMGNDYGRRRWFWRLQQRRDRRDSNVDSHSQRIGVKIVRHDRNHDPPSPVQRMSFSMRGHGRGLSPRAIADGKYHRGRLVWVTPLRHSPREKGFKEETFALRHPGGILGRQILLRASRT